MNLGAFADRLRAAAGGGFRALARRHLDAAAEAGEDTARSAARRRLRVRSGALTRSIQGSVSGGGAGLAQIRLVAGTDYGRIQEEGGVIRPRRGQYLAIPLDGSTLPPRLQRDLFAVESRAGNLLLVRRNASGGITPVFLLRRSVRLRGRGFLRAGLDAAERELPAALRRAVEGVIGAD